MNAPQPGSSDKRTVRRRLVLRPGQRISQWPTTASDAHGITERALRQAGVRARLRHRATASPVQTIDEFLDVPGEDDGSDDWIIPGLTRACGTRLVVTGAEGAGKSSLLRQLGVCIAAGIHPFTHLPMEAHRVLVIDGENGARHMRRKLRPMRTQAALQHHPVKESNLWIEAKPGGMDLARDKDVSCCCARSPRRSPTG